ncbi:MAG: bifunctional DNA primase/polymerase [Beijerinckiaceae bacterium]|nr:bifunctional DNA primase/polymerase [Beijerinckiaceae bacterium]
MSFGEAALWWTCRGFAVFPVEPRGKRPLGKLAPHGLKDASIEPRVVAAWWRQDPAANIGLAIPKGTFAVDLDGEQALQSWCALCDRNGALPPTLTVTTGRGKHLYFRSSVEVKNSLGRIAAGIDTRGHGGYTIGPPSVHPSGAVYSLDKRCLEIAEAPEWLVDMALPEVEAPPPRQHFRLSDAPARGLKGVIGTVANARQGERNSLVFWGACRAAELVSAGAIAEQFAEALLVEAAASAGLPYAEARVTVRSGLKAGERRHG